ncbi:hypothetical protein ILUMI_17855 [Ignelater luminosus]|uniref:CHK kinase-like domain-containing protein n=1 Tax=Ignelater luminosus TaxID=2038154 RepID=A0A8K0CPQ5_IGNLU|nr:hypothetical protein ILUMI_17855 [Ignelater luminosus]
MNRQQLNEDFYQTVLGEYEQNNSITITSITKTAACEIGISHVCLVSRVNVTGYKNDKVYKKSIIIKELPNPEQHHLYRSNLAMMNEMQAYRRIIPALQQHTTGHLPVANCIYAEEDLIMLEDLSLDEFKPNKNKNVGFTLVQCEVVLKALAKLHAASLVMEIKTPKLFEELIKLTKEILYYESDSCLLNYQTSYLNNVIEIFRTDSDERIIRALHDLKENSKLRLKKLLTTPRRHSVICHGDCWAGNVLFNSRNEVKLVDLQLMRYGSVARDLTYLFYVNLLPKLRRKNMERLLEEYLHVLKDNITMRGIMLDDILTKEWLDSEMKAFLEYGVVYGMWLMPLFFRRREDFEISRKSLDNSVRAIKQYDTDYKERLREIILEYVENRF